MEENIIMYKDINEQIEILKNKNILFKNEEKAKSILLRENYYNLITGYKDIFTDLKLSKKRGIETCALETYFEEIYTIYKFDRKLKNLMFYYISIIETNIKSYISNVFSKKYGTTNYLKESNFNVNENNIKKFEELIVKINSNVERNIDNYEDIKKCKEEYLDIPLWMLVTYITLGNIIKFYSLMKFEDKKEIAKIVNIKPHDINVYLKMLNIIRNISAHGNVLFNVKLDIKYEINQKGSFYHDKLNIDKINNTYKSGINDILAIIIIFKRLLGKTEYNEFILQFISIIEEVKIELDKESFENFIEAMGLPDNYNLLKEL